MDYIEVHFWLKDFFIVNFWNHLCFDFLSNPNYLNILKSTYVFVENWYEFIYFYSIQFGIILKSQRCDFFIDFIVILFGVNCRFFLLIFIMSLLVYVCRFVDHIIFVKYLELETFFLMIVFFNFPIQSMLDDFVKQTI